LSPCLASFPCTAVRLCAGREEHLVEAANGVASHQLLRAELCWVWADDASRPTTTAALPHRRHRTAVISCSAPPSLVASAVLPLSVVIGKCSSSRTQISWMLTLLPSSSSCIVHNLCPGKYLWDLRPRICLTTLLAACWCQYDTHSGFEFPQEPVRLSLTKSPKLKMGREMLL
jgi:hypothetical protein